MGFSLFASFPLQQQPTLSEECVYNEDLPADFVAAPLSDAQSIPEENIPVCTSEEE